MGRRGTVEDGGTPRRPGSAGRTRLLAGAFLALGLVVLLGPRARVDSRLEVPLPALPSDLEAWLAAREAGVPDLRVDEGKEIVWFDPITRARTPLTVVYLHGFSADRHELDPVPADVARALGANLFHTRLTGHGATPASLGAARAEDWLRDVAEAVAVGAAIGDRVILMGTSTGGTLALWAARQEAWGAPVAALVLVSPNLGPASPLADLLLWPWGNLLVRMVEGEERCFEPANPDQALHWTTCYPSRALLEMMALVHLVRTTDPASLPAPILVLLSPDDEVVSGEATRSFLGRGGGPPTRFVELEGSTDPARHVLAGDILSPGTNGAVIGAIVDFLAGIQGTPVPDRPREPR